ncbi:MAG: TonB-dependent receptor, partial [Holophagales bacterium]|nr:TonB-dependent receptor [Holophagales bacterium]
NEGTEQPKIDIRFDKNLEDGNSILTSSIGWAETDGIVHSGIGPFNINKGSGLNYGKVEWSKGALNIGFWANLLDGDATNLLTVGLDGQPLPFFFETDTFNLDFSNGHELGSHTVTYGGNYREIDFELSLAPGEDSRTEIGFFLQDEIAITDQLKWLVGARWDDIDPVGSVVSPRTSLLYSPSPEHNFRISYNEAFRAPSLVENFLDVTIINLIDVGAILASQVPPPLASQIPPIPYAFPTASLGNPLLTEEKLTAYEVGYVGTLADGKVTLTLAVYRNELEDASDFFQAQSYSPLAPPLGWPPGEPLLSFLLAQVGLDTNALLFALDLPSVFSYRNIGEEVDKGVEVSLDYRPNLQWRLNFNYSYQDETEFTGVPLGERNLPPENRFNFDVSYNGPAWYVNASVNYVDEAFWTDVLDSRFWGFTDDYTVVNLSVGVRLMEDKVTLSVTGNNIFDEDVQQHIFGDIISRKVTGQVRFHF